MTFQKSQLAVAVAMAISFSAQAQINNHGSIYIDGTASVGSANAMTETRKFNKEESPVSKVFEKAPSGPSSVYLGDGESLMVIRDGQLNALDMDLQDIDPDKEEFLSTGSESTFVIDNVTSAQTLIETNGTHIEHNGSASAIEISNSNLTGVDFDIVEGDEPVPENLVGHKELITNNGGEIISSDEYLTDPAAKPGNAIDISNSTVNGLIINEDWSGSEAPMTGGFIASTGGSAIAVSDSQWTGGVINSSRNAVSEIYGGTAGIDLINTDFVGAIINEALGTGENRPVIAGGQSAIRVTGGSFKGDIENGGLLQAGNQINDFSGAEGVIALENTIFEGNVVNNGEISQIYEAGYKNAIAARRSHLTGNIINHGQAQGAISIDGSKSESSYENGTSSLKATAGHGSLTGNVINTGNISSNSYRGAIDIYGADLTGDILNEGTIESDSEGVRISGGAIQQSTSTNNDISLPYFADISYGTRIGEVKGNIINKQGARIISGTEGIELISTNLTGNIENAGVISSDLGNGISIEGGRDASYTSSDSTPTVSIAKGVQTTLNGHIINHKSGNIEAHNPLESVGIYLENVALSGNIENHGSLTSAGNGIEVIGGFDEREESDWEETDFGSQTTTIWDRQPQTSRLTGNVINTGTISAGEHGVIIDNGAELHGKLINKGAIQGGDSGITLAGGYKESGTIVEKYIWDETTQSSDYEVDSEDTKTKLPAAFKGVIVNEAGASINSQGAGIDLSNLTASAEIINRGTINGANTGIYVADDVTGSLTIKQLAGELKGATALRMNSATRTEYYGGAIKGNVANHGGTFYVEGNQSIAGDYMQTAGSTLAMGLHRETSLTADNINLAEGSKVLIDLTKGNLYVQNGEQIELLKVNAGGTLIDTNVDYVVNSNLVTVANAERNEAGNLVLTFDRAELTAVIEDKIKNDGVKGQAAKNLTVLASAVKGNAQLEEFLIEQGDKALPDTSGASVAAAMNASSQAGTQVSVRARGLASGDVLSNSGLWMQGLVSNGKQDDRHGEAYDADSRGFVLGADTELNSGLVVGGAYSFIRSESKTANSRTNSDYHMATAYGAQAIDQILLDGQVYYAWGNNDSSRNIGASGNYDSKLYGARVGAGYQFDLAPATRFVPGLSLEASRLSVDGYTETGTGALVIGEQDFDRLELGLTTELSKDYQLDYAVVTPSLTLGAFHDFEAEAQNTTISFQGVPEITLPGRKPEENRYVAGVGLDIMSGDNLTVSAEYNYNWNGDGYDANAAALKFRWDF